MSRKSSIFLPLFLVAVSVSMTSCFKDVDFSQSQEISLEPDLEIDLVYYQLIGDDFSNSETGAFTPIIRDTVRLEFLDDDYIQENLQIAELRFRHENSFPVRINSNIKFLSESDATQFSVNYSIPPGEVSASAVIDTSIVKQGGEIRDIRRSIKMAVELEMIGGDAKTTGNLDFLSKGLFKFEF